MSEIQFRVQGERVGLRPLGPADAERARALLTSPEVRRHLNRTEIPEIEELRILYAEGERKFSHREAFYFALEAGDEPELVGTIGIRFPRHPLQANLGYWLGEPYWGRGWMSEAIRLAVHVCFRECHAVRVDALVRVGNAGSRRVLEKCGFRLDGTLRANVQSGGEWHDEWFLTLPRDDWEEPPAPRVIGTLGARAP